MNGQKHHNQKPGKDVLRDLLEPDAVKVARPVLRGLGPSNGPELPDNYFTGFYPSVRVDATGDGVVSQAGGVLLTSMVKASGITAGLSAALEPWRKPFATHDPGKILTDLALSLATGGDFASDVDRLRNQSEVYGLVASDATISRFFTTLSRVRPAKALAAINKARAAARAHV